jgi:adenylosuccinate synthase
MVVRCYPIRVANPNGNDPSGTSGPLRREISVEEIARRSNLDIDVIKRTEKTSTTGRDRRIGEFDWRQFRRAVSLNAPTDIVLTFVDYLNSENAKAYRFEQLTTETQAFIEELETVSHAPVSLINTKFEIRSIIDRRSWV